ncbi:aryl-sulfate sulfotransferase [Halorientalis brevis]|uniref:Aryl-sulfate sulfotransferase n=1 Tax=Halorientalis brevis TaxID=1126241 RepID=A0ABD6CAL1_9EURY|nr:aryl-sulfate sulfotransferase [Halorientalis brevis]
MERDRLGYALIVAAIAGLALVVAASAATAPSQEVAKENTTATLVGIQGGGLGYHDYGSVQLVDESGQRVWGIANADSYFDVTGLDNGTVMAGFMDSGYTDCGPYESPCTHTGFRILDPNATDPVVFEYSYPVRTMTNSETHDVEQLSSGEFLVSDMDHERIYTVTRNGTITWQWKASSYYDAPEDPTKTDWLHVNDVDYLGSDRFLVSVRNANQLVIVERGEGVVDVVNEDRDPDLLDKQHNPQWLAENAILVADSENDRIVELHRNGSDGEWFVAWGLQAANGLEFEWPRDADRLDNGNTLITDSRNKRVVEVTENGSVVWSTTFEYIPYEAERLPEGETVGGQVYNPAAGNVQLDSAGGIPVLTSLLSLVRAGYPIPFWVSELHLLAVLVGLGMLVGGSGLVLSDRRADEDEADANG